MSAVAPVKRTTLYIPDTGPSHNPSVPHLHIVLTNPCSKGYQLLVSISSCRTRYDKTCVLSKKDHPSFIRHDSFVNYALAKPHETKALITRMNAGDIISKGMFDERLFGFVLKGLLESPHTTTATRRYYEQNKAN